MLHSGAFSFNVSCLLCPTIDRILVNARFPPHLFYPLTMVLFGNRQPSMAAEMRLMMAYFAAFDGQRSWEDIEPVVEATYHDDLRVEEGGKTFDRAEFKAKIQKFVQEGGSMEISKLKQQPLGIHYSLTFHKPGSKAETTKSFGSFQDGKLVRVQRDNVRKAHTIL